MSLWEEVLPVLAAPRDLCFQFALFLHHMVGEASTYQRFCWSALLSVLLPTLPSVSLHLHPQHTLTPNSYPHLQTLAHKWTYPRRRTHPHSHVRLLSGIYTPALVNTHSHMLCLSLTHTPLVLVFDVKVRRSVYTLSLSLFPAAVPSLQSLFHSKQNKMKSNTDLI